MAVRTVADARRKIAILTTKPADISAISAAALTAGIDASCLVAKSSTHFAATGSETISDAAYCEDVNAQVYGQSNYTAQLAPFWLLDAATGAYADVDNAVYEAVRAKGTELTIVIREGKPASMAWAASDRYDAYVVITDNPQAPEAGNGFVKRIVPMSVQSARQDCVAVA